MPGKDLSPLCADCKTEESTLDVRKRRLCNDCFLRYVGGKVQQRMTSYRLTKALPDQRKTLLVPVSGGVSSVALLHILDKQLRRQREKSQDRISYNIHVLIVDTSNVGPNGPSRRWAESLQSIYPDHIQSFEPLSAVFSYDTELLESLGQLDFPCNPPSTDPTEEAKLQHLFSCLGSPTSKIDFQSMLLTRLVGRFAKSHGCEAVLWAHSDSKLAATALSSVAKGRGCSVPSQICDGPSPWGPAFNYPARDLFKFELELYFRLAEPSLSDLIMWDPNVMATSVSIKNSAIDNLLTTYITSQGAKYPSIMANVVRTSSKLQTPKPTDPAMACSLCSTPISQGIITSSANSNPTESDSPKDLCYGCSRIRQELLDHLR